MQAVVNEHMLFMNVYIGWPGSVHDQRVLLNSRLFAEAHHLFSDGSYLLADAGYAALPWIVPAYRETSVGEYELQWNHVHSSCRMVVERTFGVFKGRWRMLKHMEIVDPDTSVLCDTAVSCCILHNYLMMDGTTDYDAVEEEDEDLIVVEPPPDLPASVRGGMFRAALVQYMHA
jgi:hypothetical protein